MSLSIQAENSSCMNECAAAVSFCSAGTPLHDVRPAILESVFVKVLFLFMMSLLLDAHVRRFAASVLIKTTGNLEL